MMEGLRSWLLSGLTAGVVCALAESLMPRGPVRVVGRLACGLVLACVFLEPIVSVDLHAGESWLQDYRTQVEEISLELESGRGDAFRTIIEEEFAAYIADKAAREGLCCTVRIHCREEDGIWLPHRATVSGLSEGEQDRVAQWLEEDIGIPTERQRFDEGEEST